MTHIFKPGDRAYWLVKEKWIELVENTEKDSYLYPLFNKDFYATFTAEGRRNVKGGDISLLPINPYDPTDPLNPPEFKWPFFLNGRPVGIGDELILKHNQESLWVTSLIYGKDVPKVCGNPSFGYFLLTPENFCWPDEVPKKKTTYLWAIPMYEAGLKENMSIGFKRMTKEEAEKYWKAEIVPGSEEKE